MIRTAAATLTATLGLVVAIPLVTSGPAPAPVDTVGHCVEIDLILATIRAVESGGRYDTPPNAASASGAYQYVRSTWAGHGGYPDAYLAPPHTQDTRARSDVETILATRHTVTAVPLGWYYPAALDNPDLLDRVPAPHLGNRLTPRQYQDRWLDHYQTALAAAGVTCGAAPRTAAELAAHPNITLTAAARADLDAGIVDWRLVSLLTTLADTYTFDILNFRTGHTRCAVLPGGRNTGPDCHVSNHWHGRATDLTAVGPATGPARGVNRSNSHARALLETIAAMHPDDPVTPDEIGQPWPDLAARRGWFTNNLHRTHLHLAYETFAPPPPPPPADPVQPVPPDPGGAVPSEAARLAGARGDVDLATAERRLVDRPDVLWMATFDRPGDWWTNYGVSGTFGPADAAGTLHGRRMRPAAGPSGSAGKSLQIDFNPDRQAAHTDSAKFGARYHQTFDRMGMPTEHDDELYFRYRVFVPADFGCDTVGGKLPGLAGNPHASDRPGSGSGGGDYWEWAWSGRLMWRSNCAVAGYFYVAQAGSEKIGDGRLSNGRYVGIDPYFRHADGSLNRLRKGEWNTIEIHYRMNTPGKHDGRITAWLNGIESIDLPVTFYGPKHQKSGWGINVVRMDAFYGGAAGVDRHTQLWFDDIVIAEQPIGARRD